MWFLSLLFTVLSLCYLSISINFSGLYIISLAGANLASLSVFTFFALLFVVTMASLTNRYVYHNALPQLNSNHFALTIKSIYLWSFFGFALVMLSILLSYLFGGGELSITHASLVDAFYYSFIMALFPGVTEELCFRWLFYGVLRRQYNKILSATVVGIVFALLHFNQVSTTKDMIFLLVSGLSVNYLFCAIYERTGSIWPGIIFHVVWDILSLNNLIHFSDGSQPDEHNVFIITLHTQNELVSGGGFGFESSIFSIAIYLLAMLAILHGYRKEA
ncbi:TPA: lysostaphin resistance A-like protein [Enterobacter ludwigii]|nr:CPBP family intramembrane metalloprotease [Enterobacter ludwigii]